MRCGVMLIPVFGCFATLISSGIATADEKVGSFKNIVAWRNLQPPNNKIIVIGKIIAPNPCYKSEVNQFDDKDSTKLNLKVTMKPGVGICIQQIADIEFRYEQDGKNANYTDAEVVSETDKKKVSIGTAS